MADDNELKGFEPNSWESLDENMIKTEINGLATRIINVTKLLERMVYNNDFDKTQQDFDKLWMEDFGANGFVPAFFNVNEGTFGKFKDESSAPPWYGNLSAEEKKAFDTSQHYFSDDEALVKPMAALRQIMMLLPLKNSFKFMRITLNFDEAGYNEDLYHKIDDDMMELSDLFNKSWDVLESHAYNSKRYFEENYKKLDKSSLNNGYRQARLKDYIAELETSKLRGRFISRGNGKFSVDSGFLADMKVIDKYTMQIASLDNIESDMKETIENCKKLAATLNETVKVLKTAHYLALADNLSQLNHGIMDYAEGGLNVWNCYKNRDTDSPYCFVRKLPAFGKMSGKYSLYPLSTDPWHDGTDFYRLYQNAAESLGDHCYDYVYNHGQPELR